MSGSSGVRSVPSLGYPIRSSGNGETGASRQRIDDKVFQSRVPSRRPELQDFEAANPCDGNRSRQQSISSIGQAECEPDQNERERMFAVLTEFGVRAEPGRAQRRERDGSGQKPRKYSQNGCHRDSIS